jgi:hypothetical protein
MQLPALKNTKVPSQSFRAPFRRLYRNWRAGDSGGSVVREGVPVGDCNDKPGSLTVTARISRSLQTPRNLPLSREIRGAASDRRPRPVG